MSTHYGVYAVVIEAGRLLCVQKARGPYEGQLDLPGGAPEAGETPEAALARELLEETGGREGSCGPWHSFDFFVERDSKGAAIQFQHQGMWRFCELTGLRPDLPAREDVAGLEWVQLSTASGRHGLSPLVHQVLGSGPFSTR
jgi:8-oxo-dGTP pyrophosphatase MutT (NUDIX family)